MEVNSRPPGSAGVGWCVACFVLLEAGFDILASTWRPAYTTWLPPGGRLTPSGFHLASTWRPPGFHLASNLAHLGSNLVQHERFGVIWAPSWLAQGLKNHSMFLLCQLFAFCTPCWSQLRSFWALLASSWRHLGSILAPFGASWPPLGAILAPSWGYLAPQEVVLEASWRLLGASWVLLEPS